MTCKISRERKSDLLALYLFTSVSHYMCKAASFWDFHSALHQCPAIGRDHFYIINATLDQLLSCKTMEWAQVGLYSCTASTGKLWGGHMDNRSEDKGGSGIARPFQIPEMFNVTSWGHGSLEARRELKRETFLTLVNLWSGIISPCNRLQLRF